MSVTNTPVPVRKGEEIPLSALLDWMREEVSGVKGPLSVLQYPGGFSNLTYLISDENKNAWVLRRPPLGVKSGTAHDMLREYHILSALESKKIAPAPIAYCENNSVIGAPFYLMENVSGTVLRTKLPDSPQASSAILRKLSDQSMKVLTAIHSTDWQESSVLRNMARPEGYVSRQIEGWGKRYQLAETKTIGGAEEVMEWLDEEQPTESDACLIHNDFKYDNLILNPNNWSLITAVLDWEMATIGDPLMDLGTTLGYWTEPNDPAALKMFSVTHLENNLSRFELLQRYEEYSGRTVENPVYYYTFGVFKIAVIAEQIYARYKKGLTQDARFASLHKVTEAAIQLAVQAIETDSFSHQK